MLNVHVFVLYMFCPHHICNYIGISYFCEFFTINCDIGKYNNVCRYDTISLVTIKWRRNETPSSLPLAIKRYLETNHVHFVLIIGPCCSIFSFVFCVLCLIVISRFNTVVSVCFRLMSLDGSSNSFASLLPNISF